jgi:hypothetical protein
MTEKTYGFNNGRQKNVVCNLSVKLSSFHSADLRTRFARAANFPLLTCYVNKYYVCCTTGT